MSGLYLFGLDRDEPRKCAQTLKKMGFEAVVSPGGQDAAQACRDEGLAVWACVGAFSLREGDPESYLAEDAFGRRRPWFHSGCPNEPALWARSLERAAQAGAEAVFLDGARFASPEPGEELFLSCFCPRCMRKGEALGYDMEKLRADVRRFAETPGAPVPEEWLLLRRETVREYFAAFNRAVRSAGAKAGAFVFAPSLARLVGQGFVYEGESGPEVPDLLAPMLYRRYAPRPGIACLNAEYAALAEFLRRRGDGDVPARIEQITGVRVPQAEPERLREEGFPPESVARETAAASASGAVLAPILQLDDERLPESVSAAREGGAEMVGLFAYRREFARFLEKLK